MGEAQNAWDAYGEWEASVAKRLPDYCQNTWEDMDSTLKANLYALFAPLERDGGPVPVDVAEAARAAAEEIEPAAVLCYVSGGKAFFTTKPLSEQWGDDWNDSPYEHNAGEPYWPCWHNHPRHRYSPTSKRGWKSGTKEPLDVGELCRCASCLRDWHEDGTPTWRVYQVFWEGPFDEPNDGTINSRYSVEDINSGAVAWLRPSRYSDWEGKRKQAIPAGTTYAEFMRIVTEAGGCVYVPAVAQKAMEDL